MAFIENDDLEYLQKRFGEELKEPVKLKLFANPNYLTAGPGALEPVEAFAAEAQQATGQILEELVAISPDHLKLEVYDAESEEGRQAAAGSGVNLEMLPAIAYESAGLKGQSRYYGLPSGYEFGSLVENIVDLSKGEVGLRQATLDKVAGVNEPVKVLVFVTPT